MCKARRGEQRVLIGAFGQQRAPGSGGTHYLVIARSFKKFHPADPNAGRHGCVARAEAIFSPERKM